MIAIDACGELVAAVVLLTQGADQERLGNTQESIRFVEGEIGCTRQAVAIRPRTFMVVSHVLSPGLDAAAAQEIVEDLKRRELSAEIIAGLERRLGIRQRPDEVRMETVYVDMQAQSGNALRLTGGTTLDFWADWSSEANYRMDFFPVAIDGEPEAQGRLQVRTFEDSEYDPLKVMVDDIHEQLEWGFGSATAGKGVWLDESGMQTLRVHWIKTLEEPNPVRLGMHLAFSAIGKEVVWTLRRCTDEQTGQLLTQLTISQLDDLNALLRSEVFQWSQAWPSALSLIKIDYFPGGRHIRRCETRTIIPQSATQFSAVLSITPKRAGASVLDWRIDGEVGEYSFKNSLPPLKELQGIIQRAKH